MLDEKLHEECGVFGVYSPRNYDIAKDVYYGLYALQHRGQESCGIVVNDDGLFFSHKDITRFRVKRTSMPRFFNSFFVYF